MEMIAAGQNTLGAGFFGAGQTLLPLRDDGKVRSARVSHCTRLWRELLPLAYLTFRKSWGKLDCLVPAASLFSRYRDLEQMKYELFLFRCFCKWKL